MGISYYECYHEWLWECLKEIRNIGGSELVSSLGDIYAVNSRAFAGDFINDVSPVDFAENFYNNSNIAK